MNHLDVVVIFNKFQHFYDVFIRLPRVSPSRFVFRFKTFFKRLEIGFSYFVFGVFYETLFRLPLDLQPFKLLTGEI